MRYRIIIAAAGLASVASLAACVVPDDRLAYDTRYDRPYYDRYAYSAPPYYYYGPSSGYYYAPRASDWNYRTSSWDAARWDSRWSDRFRRNPDGVDRP